MNLFYDNFLAALAERYPQKSNLVDALMDVLPLEKESIYRRLRKDTYFTLEEAMIIAGAWNISLDNIARTTPHKSSPFQFDMVDYINPKEIDYRFFEKFNQAMELVAKDPAGKMIEVSNTLPGSLYLGYENLTRFFTMKWFYKYNVLENTLVFGDTHVPQRMRELEMEYSGCVRDIPEVYAICNDRFIENLIDDIRYFKSVRMITESEITLLKGELLEVINYIENVALKGYFPDTKNKLFFYLSHIWLETEYVLYESKDFIFSMVKILELGGICSLDKKVFDKFMNTTQSIKRSSALLSASNNVYLIEFLEKQRNIIKAF
jgi:hypothetical protein